MNQNFSTCLYIIHYMCWMTHGMLDIAGHMLVVAITTVSLLTHAYVSGIKLTHSYLLHSICTIVIYHGCTVACLWRILRRLMTFGVDLLREFLSIIYMCVTHDFSCLIQYSHTLIIAKLIEFLVGYLVQTATVVMTKT